MLKKSLLLVAAFAAVTLPSATLLAQHEGHGHAGGDIRTLEVLSVEHQHLHEDLAAALESGGKTAEAAQAVADALKRHFGDEEEYALPPLSLLEPLAHGKATEEMRPAIAMADKLRANYDKMLAEHKDITAACERLRAAAREEDKPQAAAFAEGLILHARHEEAILYPATLLVGERVKADLAAAPHADH